MKKILQVFGSFLSLIARGSTWFRRQLAKAWTDADGAIRPERIRRGAQLVMLLFLLLAVVGGIESLGLKTQYNIRQFFPKYHPLLRQDEIVTARFHLQESSPVLIVVRIPDQTSEDWTTTAHLQAVRDLTAELKTFSEVREVRDIANLQGAIPQKEALGIGPIIDYLSVEALKKEIASNPVLSPFFISKDGRILTIYVVLQELTPSETGVVKRKILGAAQAKFPFAEAALGGVPAIQSDVSEIIREEVVRFIVVAAIMSFLALVLIFRNWQPILVCGLSALLTNILSVWGITVFGFNFNILSATIPILVTMTVISIAIHSILRLIERSEQFPQKNQTELIVLTFRELYRPNLLTALTTSVGFFTLTLSDAPIIKEFGLSVGLALLFTWITVATFMPALLLLLKMPILRPWMRAKATWPFWILRNHRLVLGLILVVSGIGAWRGQHLSWNARLFDDLPENHAVRRTTEMVDHSLGGLVPLDLEIHLSASAAQKNSGDNLWAKEKRLLALDELAREIRVRQGVGSVLTMSDVLQASGLRRGVGKASPEEILFLLSMSAENPMTQYLSSDGQSTRLAIHLQDLPGSRMWNLVQDIRRAAKMKFPEAKIRMAGTAAYVHDINNALAKDMLFGFWQAMAVIFVLLVISYRSVVWAVLACLPNLTPPALLLGALSLGQVAIKPGIAIILSISLGLAFNNTVYLLERMRQMLGKGVSHQKSLFHTFWSEANPCFLSSLVLIVGFASFAVSYFKMNQLFGIFMVLSVLTGLVGDLIMLPALLQFVTEKGSQWLRVPQLDQPVAREAPAASTLLSLVPIFLGLSVALCPGQQVQAAPATGSAVGSELDQLAHRMQELVSTKDESGSIEMIITDSDGSTKKREMKYSRLNQGNGHFTVIRMLTPKDLKGTALLSIMRQSEKSKTGAETSQQTSQQEEKYVFLPSSKQTRKVATSEGNARVLDSELYTEDFDLATVQTATSHLLPNAPDGSSVIETQITETKSPYGKTIATVSKDAHLQKAEVFDKKGVLLKKIDFLGYTSVASGKIRAEKILIENVQNKRKTELHFKNISVNANLKEKDFTPAALGSGF